MLKFACPTIVESCKQMNLMFAPQLFFKMIQHHFHLFSPLILQFNIYIVLHCISKYTNICYIMHIFIMCSDGLGNMSFFFFLFCFCLDFVECQRKIWHRLQMSREINRFKTSCQICTNSKT